MARTVSIDNLAEAIVDSVREYTSDVEDAIPDVVERHAKAALKDLKDNSPEETGDYRKGWRLKKVYSRDGFTGFTLHNKTDYQLTHLLEFGHANRDGGRTAARPHIAAVAEEHGRLLTEDLKLVVGGR